MGVKGMKKKAFPVLLLMCLCLLLGASNAYAASRGWVRTKNCYYYYRNGKKVKGRVRIGNKTYYFDKNGVQRTSWRKIGKVYYCFNTGNADAGYMLTNTKKNGIALGKDGKAALTSKRARKKAKLMARISKLLDKIAKPAVSKKTKLKKAYDYLRKKYPYRFTSHFRKKDPNWDIWSANALMNNGYADCHPYASTYAYLANAIGMEKVHLMSAGTHSYVRIGSRYYDVSLGRFRKNKYVYFNMSKKKVKKKLKKFGHTKVIADLDLSNL